MMATANQKNSPPKLVEARRSQKPLKTSAPRSKNKNKQHNTREKNRNKNKNFTLDSKFA